MCRRKKNNEDIHIGKAGTIKTHRQVGQAGTIKKHRQEGQDGTIKIRTEVYGKMTIHRSMSTCISHVLPSGEGVLHLHLPSTAGVVGTK